MMFAIVRKKFTIACQTKHHLPQKMILDCSGDISLYFLRNLIVTTGAKFSALRQANGGNYNMNARAAIFGVEKILRSGITYSVMNCNVALRTEKHDRGKGTSIRETSVPYPKVRASDILANFDEKDLAVLEEPKKTAGSFDNKNCNYMRVYVCVCVFVWFLR